MPAKGVPEHSVGAGEIRVYVTKREGTVIYDVGAGELVHQGSVSKLGLLYINDRLERFIVHIDERTRVFGDVAVPRHDRRYALADVSNLVDCQAVLGQLVAERGRTAEGRTVQPLVVRSPPQRRREARARAEHRCF